METGSSLYKFNAKLMAAMEYSALMSEVLHLLLAQKTLPIAGSQEQLIEWLGTIQVHRKGLDPPHCTRSSDSSKPLQKQAQTSNDSTSSSASTTVVVSVDPTPFNDTTKPANLPANEPHNQF